ncbi:phosphonate C-P lyase system protein PhnG [Sporosarcina sp. FSL K6-1522]|uniref:phosphonate C-P lyase system protein PhnG n=1 Tax=Sporosarcina sp. FSL K6-1522 TaxID=2921554 RepID=UPI00315A3DE0
MNRRKRTEILINGSRNLARELVQEIERNYAIHVVAEPHHALTMIKVRETAKKSIFHLGEVLVTETKVSINQAFGVGVVVGDEEELSYLLAVIDAAYEANLTETKSWTLLLEAEEKRIRTSRAIQEASILKTKVNFEMMDA